MHLNILVVEDNNTEKAARLLPEDWQVTYCDNSYDAIQLIKKEDSFQLLMLDEYASPLSAYQTFDYLKSEIKTEVPVLVLGEEGENGILEHYQNKMAFIKKPVTSNDIKIINDLVEKNFVPKEVSDKAYSLEYLNVISDSNFEFIKETLVIFRTSVKDKLIQLREALGQNDFKSVAEIAHNIKPSFEMLENKISVHICDLLNNRAPKEEVPELVTELESQFDKINTELENYFPELK
ncbi:Hpt domain-containing protein [Flavobacterium rakeshii]|uniref:Hpt domain-containing protein n=1 Tax=Flavobacterium rakeshii TaxID=1038845 RepID=UPI002E7B407E|nr:Hpt domain-containing protein [Flavobacterium rakeshii]MEE1899818.1 Hpt domain-containing protein [Flavobacterium rakeshii]